MQSFVSCLVLCMACSDSEAPTTSNTATDNVETTMEAPSMEAPSMEAPTTEATMEATNVEADSPARPPGPAPALDSIRWGPDRRDPEETIESLDALAREHFGQPARVAGRLRARHNRDRISLAIVATVSNDDYDEEIHELSSMICCTSLSPRPERFTSTVLPANSDACFATQAMA